MKKIVLSVNSSWNVVNFRAGLIRAFIAEGYEVVVIAPRDEYSDKIVALGCRYVELPMDQQGTSVFADIKTIRSYLKILRQEKPDVYLGYTVKPNVYGSLACRFLRIPVINNVAGLGTAFLRGGLLGFIVSHLYRLAFGKFKCVFFQNNDDQTQFVKAGLVKLAQTQLLPGSGVDLKKYQPSVYAPRTAEKTQFLFIGRILKDKGVVELIEATKLIQQKYPEVVVQLLGATGVANRTAISREEVEVWESDGLIEYLGMSDDVLPIIEGADCVVLPSYREGTPRVLLEAGALCRPLITTDVPGCRQVVDDEVNGFLCQSHSAEDLADKMISFIEMPETKKLQMSQASRQKVENEYDEKIVIQSYLQAIAECIS